MDNLWVYLKFGFKIITIIPVIVHGVNSLWLQVQKSLDLKL